MRFSTRSAHTLPAAAVLMVALAMAACSTSPWDGPFEQPTSHRQSGIAAPIGDRIYWGMAQLPLADGRGPVTLEDIQLTGGAAAGEVHVATVGIYLLSDGMVGVTSEREYPLPQTSEVRGYVVRPDVPVAVLFRLDAVASGNWRADTVTVTYRQGRHGATVTEVLVRLLRRCREGQRLRARNAGPVVRRRLTFWSRPSPRRPPRRVGSSGQDRAKEPR